VTTNTLKSNSEGIKLTTETGKALAAKKVVNKGARKYVSRFSSHMDN
jgi:hypothetical protein